MRLAITSSVLLHNSNNTSIMAHTMWVQLFSSVLIHCTKQELLEGEDDVFFIYIILRIVFQGSPVDINEGSEEDVYRGCRRKLHTLLMLHCLLLNKDMSGYYLHKAILCMCQSCSLASLLKHESQVYPDVRYNVCYKISYGTNFKSSATAGAAWPTCISLQSSLIPRGELGVQTDDCVRQKEMVKSLHRLWTSCPLFQSTFASVRLCVCHSLAQGTGIVCSAWKSSQTLVTIRHICF